MVDPRPVRPGAKADEEPPPTPEEIASQGAQVVLPPGSEAAAGAQGTAGETFVENTQARDEGLEDMGLDPQDPSGELTDPEPPATVPSVVDVPHAQQAGDTLHVRRWATGLASRPPTPYAWQIDGAVLGPDSAVYTVDAGLTSARPRLAPSRPPTRSARPRRRRPTKWSSPGDREHRHHCAEGPPPPRRAYRTGG